MHSLSIFYLFKIFAYFKKHTDKTNTEVGKKKVLCYTYFKFLLGRYIWLNDYKEQELNFSGMI